MKTQKENNKTYRFLVTILQIYIQYINIYRVYIQYIYNLYIIIFFIQLDAQFFARIFSVPQSAMEIEIYIVIYDIYLIYSICKLNIRKCLVLCFVYLQLEQDKIVKQIKTKKKEETLQIYKKKKRNALYNFYCLQHTYIPSIYIYTLIYIQNYIYLYENTRIKAAI